MVYVITDGDEGVQLNEGTRLAFAGAGVNLPGFSKAVKILSKQLGEELRIVASAENDWIKKEFELDDFEQANATMQQQVEALADTEGLLYAGYIPFADPKELKHGVKGHMVRPKGIHIANKIAFTLGGGEQTYNLGNYMISADWVSKADEKIVKEIIEVQIAHYEAIAGKELERVYESGGELGDEVAEKNKAMLEKVGI